MQTSVYDNIYTYLGHMKALYSRSGGEEMCALADICEELTALLETVHPSLFADAKASFLKCLDRMYDIVFSEDDDDLRDEGTDYLDEVLSIVDKLA